MEAVVQAHTQELHAMFGKWELIADPYQRLLALLQTAREQEHVLARYGCPHGSLFQELDKEDGQLVNVAAQIFQVYLDWTETQIRLLGKDEQEASDLAIDLIEPLIDLIHRNNGTVANERRDGPVSSLPSYPQR